MEFELFMINPHRIVFRFPELLLSYPFRARRDVWERLSDESRCSVKMGREQAGCYLIDFHPPDSIGKLVKFNERESTRGT